MDFFWHILYITAAYIPNLLCYNFLFGKGKIFHFGPVGVNVVTAYAIVLGSQHSGSHVLGVLVGICAALIISLFFAWLSLRLQPDGLGIMSIAVHLTLLAVVLNWTQLTRGALGIPGVERYPFLTEVWHFACFMLVIAGGWFLVIRFLDRGAFGRQVVALSEHEWHAQGLGISRVKINFLLFSLSGIGTVLSLMLHAQYLGLLHPNDFLFPVLIFYVTCVVAGNPGNMLGVLCATVLLVLLKEGLRFLPFPAGLTGPVELILFGVILFFAVWWRRDTLFPHQRTV